MPGSWMGRKRRLTSDWLDLQMIQTSLTSQHKQHVHHTSKSLVRLWKSCKPRTGSEVQEIDGPLSTQHLDSTSLSFSSRLESSSIITHAHNRTWRFVILSCRCSIDWGNEITCCVVYWSTFHVIKGVDPKARSKLCMTTLGYGNSVPFVRILRASRAFADPAY